MAFSLPAIFYGIKVLKMILLLGLIDHARKECTQKKTRAQEAWLKDMIEREVEKFSF